MTTAARVVLWGSEIGTVYLPENAAYASFEYDKSFLPSGIQVSPVVMPLTSQIYSFPALPIDTFHGLPGLLSDSLPDRFGNAVINSWLARQGRSPDSFSAIERLCYTGRRGMGALEYYPATGPQAEKDEPLDIAALSELASEILSSRESVHIDSGNGDLAQILQIGTSAGGARAKAVIAWNEKTGDVRSGQINAGPGYGYWLIKFDGVRNNGDRDIKDPPTYTRVEYAYSLMAKAAGITMSDCRLYKENEAFHFITRRFDRDAVSGKKIHMQTLGALAHFDFNSPGAYSYEQAASVCRQMNLGSRDLEQLFRRAVFNDFARNFDDHVKNISFLMDRNGRWSLSPAYDITYAFKPGNRWLGNHQMSINGRRNTIARNDLVNCALSMDISAGKAENIMEDIRAALRRWPEFAEAAELPETVYERIFAELALSF